MGEGDLSKKPQQASSVLLHGFQTSHKLSLEANPSEIQMGFKAIHILFSGSGGGEEGGRLASLSPWEEEWGLSLQERRRKGSGLAIEMTTTHIPSFRVNNLYSNLQPSAPFKAHLAPSYISQFLNKEFCIFFLHFDLQISQPIQTIPASTLHPSRLPTLLDTPQQNKHIIPLPQSALTCQTMEIGSLQLLTL